MDLFFLPSTRSILQNDLPLLADRYVVSMDDAFNAISACARIDRHNLLGYP